MRNIFTCILLLFSIVAFAQDSTKQQDADTVQAKAMDEVVVSASRMSEKLLQSPVSVEKVTEAYFARNSGASFFDALQSLKGVQMITPSLGFRVINTRGFANTTNVRFAQLVNGMDMQSPHIGAPVGNALGPTDLDIQSVEIVPGSASALYGMNTINGMANFFTKDPFLSQGISVQQKTGVNHLNDPGTGAHLYTETSLRFAHAFSSRFAVKLNASLNKGYDWIADDRTDLNATANSSTGLTGERNPAKDPVNGYGNESSNRRTLSLNGKNYVVSRTGYFETDVADYSLQNLKADLGLYYKPTENTSLSYTYHRANFNTIYQRSNRFRLQGYVLQQHGIDYASQSIKAKAYVNLENTGESFNLRSMAENMDRLTKTDDQWFAAYSSKFSSALGAGQPVDQAHRTARAFADEGRPQPRTALFASGFQKLQNINNWDSGAALRVKAALVHAEVQFDLTQNWLSAWKQKGVELLTGFDSRTYVIVPDGNYFINPEKGKEYNNLLYGRWGGFLSASKKLGNKLKAGVVTRVDKNDYFSAKTNIRATLVYSPSYSQNFRLAYQNGYRYPSIFEAFSNVNSGGVKRIGGLRVMSNGVFENAWLKSSIDAFRAAVNRDINTSGLSKKEAIAKNKELLVKNGYTYLQPEHIRSREAGYRSLFFHNRLFVDIDFYFNQYKDFIAQVEASTPNTSVVDSIPTALFDTKTQSRYRLWTNSKTMVYNYGSALKLQYNFTNDITVDYNLAFAKILKTAKDDGLEDGFNTPKWMMNLGISKDNIVKNLGAGLMFRWQDGYYWQSFLVNGDVPAQGALDAQVSYKFSTLPLQVKFGATNLTNHYQASYLGGPQTGGFYYTTVSYDFKK